MTRGSHPTWIVFASCLGIIVFALFSYIAVKEYRRNASLLFSSGTDSVFQESDRNLSHYVNNLSTHVIAISFPTKSPQTGLQSQPDLVANSFTRKSPQEDPENIALQQPQPDRQPRLNRTQYLSSGSFSKFPEMPLHTHKHVRSFATSIWDAGIRINGDTTPLRRMLEKLQNRQPVTLRVYGGSFTEGQKCTEGALTRRTCAWSARFASKLRNAYRGAQLDLDNLATGGCTTRCTVDKIRAFLGQDRPPDCVILDHACNDRKIGWPTANKHGERECFGSRNRQLCYNGIAEETSIALEVLIRHFLSFSPAPQIIVFVSLPSIRFSAKLDDERPLQDAYEKVCKRYSIPLISFFDSINEFVRRGGKRSHLWVGDISHPTWETHEYIADMFVHFFNVQKRQKIPLMQELPPPLHTTAELNHYVMCKPMTQHVAYRAMPKTSKKGHAVANNATPSVSWRLYEDRPKKPGWIANGTLGRDDLNFTVAFGAEPMLIVSFLKSYEGFGEAIIWLHSPNEAYTLDGSWQSRSSQTHSVQIKASSRYSAGVSTDDGHVEAGFGVLPHSNATVRVRLSKGEKFKITSVVTC